MSFSKIPSLSEGNFMNKTSHLLKHSLEINPETITQEGAMSKIAHRYKLAKEWLESCKDANILTEFRDSNSTLAILDGDSKETESLTDFFSAPILTTKHGKVIGKKSDKVNASIVRKNLVSELDSYFDSIIAAKNYSSAQIQWIMDRERENLADLEQAQLDSLCQIVEPFTGDEEFSVFDTLYQGLEKDFDQIISEDSPQHEIIDEVGHNALCISIFSREVDASIQYLVDNNYTSAKAKAYIVQFLMPDNIWTIMNNETEEYGRKARKAYFDFKSLLKPLNDFVKDRQRLEYNALIKAKIEAAKLK